MAWYLNRALTTLRAEVNARWPDRDRQSDGTIGDAAHQARPSDHNPDADRSVDAWDMDVDGVDVWAIINAFERHPAAGYWIYNDQIALRDEGWRRRSYAYAGPGRNRHTRHVHFNSRQAYETSTAPWGIAEEDNVDSADITAIATTSARAVHNQKLGQSDTTIGVAVQDTHRSVTGLPAKVDAILVAVTGGDSTAVLARINELAAEESARDAELRALVEQGLSGELHADEVVRLIGARLAVAPQA